MIDTLIVGAGPAGATAAYVLARRGVEVALLDRSMFPRPKVCGDVIIKHSVEVLTRLGLSRALGPSHLYGIGPPVRDRRYARYVVPRARFDSALLSEAVGAGACFVQCRVDRIERIDESGWAVGGELPTGGRLDLQARILVGADGARSLVRRATQTDNPCDSARTAHAIRQYFDGRHGLSQPATFSLGSVSGSGATRGYGWVAPVGQTRLNVGVVRFGRGASVGLLREFRSFTADLWMGWGRRMCARPVDRPRSAPIPFDFSSMHEHGDALLLGDAAGLARPLSGEGISHALKSAEMAADVIYEHLNYGAPLSNYWEAVAAEIEPVIAAELEAAAATSFYARHKPVWLMPGARSMPDPDLPAQPASTTGSAVYVRAGGSVSVELDGVVIIGNPETRRGIVLSRASAGIWTSLERPTTPGRLADELGSREGLSDECARNHVTALIGELMTVGVVEECDQERWRLPRSEVRAAGPRMIEARGPSLTRRNKIALVHPELDDFSAWYLENHQAEHGRGVSSVAAPVIATRAIAEPRSYDLCESVAALVVPAGRRPPDVLLAAFDIVDRWDSHHFSVIGALLRSVKVIEVEFKDFAGPGRAVEHALGFQDARPGVPVGPT